MDENKKFFKLKELMKFTINTSEKPDLLKMGLQKVNKITQNQIANCSFDRNKHLAFATSLWFNAIRNLLDNLDLNINEKCFLESQLNQSLAFISQGCTYKQHDSIAIGITDGIYQFINHNTELPLQFIKNVVSKAKDKRIWEPKSFHRSNNNDNNYYNNRNYNNNNNQRQNRNSRPRGRGRGRRDFG